MIKYYVLPIIVRDALLYDWQRGRCLHWHRRKRNALCHNMTTAMTSLGGRSCQLHCNFIYVGHRHVCGPSPSKRHYTARDRV